jgi:prevent-host-death family protein
MSARVSTAEVREDLAKVVRRTAQGERIKVTRYGKTLAVLIPKRDLEALEGCEKAAAEKKKAAAGSARRPR